jgi:hypothetical protein
MEKTAAPSPRRSGRPSCEACRIFDPVRGSNAPRSPPATTPWLEGWPERRSTRSRRPTIRGRGELPRFRQRRHHRSGRVRFRSRQQRLADDRVHLQGRGLPDSRRPGLEHEPRDGHQRRWSDRGRARGPGRRAARLCQRWRHLQSCRLPRRHGDAGHRCQRCRTDRGDYFDAAGIEHGFVSTGGTFTAIDFPGATATAAAGINSTGDIVGLWSDGTTTRGFLPGRPLHPHHLPARHQHGRLRHQRRGGDRRFFTPTPPATPTASSTPAGPSASWTSLVPATPCSPASRTGGRSLAPSPTRWMNSTA